MQSDPVQRSIAIFVPCVGVRSRLDQRGHRFRVGGGLCYLVQGSLAVFIPCVGIGSPLHQGSNDLGIVASIAAYHVQGGLAGFILSVRVGPGLQQQGQDFQVGVALGGPMEGSRSVVAQLVGVGARLEQGGHGVGIGVAHGRPFQWDPAIRAASPRPGIGPGFYQRGNDFRIGVEGCRHLQGGPSPLVQRLGIGAGSHQSGNDAWVGAVAGCGVQDSLPILVHSLRVEALL